MSKNVAIINYGLGNLSSVLNALEFIEAKAFIAQTPDELKNASHTVLPGVGAFGEGMQHLNEQGWTQPIHDFAKADQKPFLGICLGMQLLADSSREHGNHEGLGLIAGKVDRMTKTDDIRIPHIGWNATTFKEGSKTYENIESPDDFYYVHSYIFHAENDDDVSAICSHGQDFTASVEHENIWGVQFHPEKSQKAGLQILKNFWELDS
jgi:glutamine amidotransferase